MPEKENTFVITVSIDNGSDKGLTMMMIYLFIYILVGFYDTAEEELPDYQPDFKKLRQDHLDGKMRDDVEQVKIKFHFPDLVIFSRVQTRQHPFIL